MDAKIAQKRQTGSSARMTVLCGVTACVVCGIFLLFNYFLVNQRISMLEERLDRLQRRGKPNTNISLQSPGGGVLPNMGYIGMCGPKG